jgi:hypothetical protein
VSVQGTLDDGREEARVAAFEKVDREDVAVTFMRAVA